LPLEFSMRIVTSVISLLGGILTIGLPLAAFAQARVAFVTSASGLADLSAWSEASEVLKVD